MKNITKMELHRAIKNKWMIVAIGIGIGIAILQIIDSKLMIKGFLNTYSNNGDNMYWPKVSYSFTIYDGWIGIQNCSYRRLLFFVMPLLSAIPYANSLCLDRKNGYASNICVKVKKKHYYRAKAIAVFVSSGIIAITPLIVNLLLWAMIFPFSTPNPVSGGYGINGLVIFADIFFEHSVLYILIYITYVFVFYGLLTCMALFLSVWDDNRFVVSISPFILFFSVHTFFAYFERVYYSPIEMIIMPTLQKDYAWFMGIIFVIMILAVIVFLRESRRDILK